MYLNLSYRSIFDQLAEALTKKTLIVTSAKTRRIGKTAALVHLATIKELPIVVMDLLLDSYTRKYPSLKIIGETAAERSTHLSTVLVDEGVQEKTITILRDKGVTVSGFLLDRSTLKAGEKYVPYEERRKIEHGIEYTKELGILKLMTKEEAENLEPQTFEDPPLLQITLKDINSIPEVIHKGESLKERANIDFNWESSGPDEFGSTYINLQTADITSKYPAVNRTQYKRGKALNELPTKDDLVWDKERGVYILQKKK
ncbi:hypothetical protein [Bacillus pumilus]|uniref:Uncharacterized protein n=1 Tax=Bacillus pumilus TaxID=1408 RepID=A0AAD0HPA1_BACPU|nr:hypothetical protein [Bacillus pumilus]AVM24905.1 hypothetical protein C5695_14020 [Bacillus pumilus]TYS42008.1 hypothetical protein FZC68_10805 [Bacillus pumilus]